MTLVAHKFKIVKKLQNETFVNISVVSHKKDEVIHTLTTTDGFIIPICQGTAEYKSGLRKAFITPGKDWYFITADYGQEELRLAGIFSGEKNIIEPIQQGKDIHTYVAQKMFGFSDKHHRTRVKTLNFGVLYGCTKYTVARKLNISPEEGQQLLDRYYKTMKKLESWIDYMHKLGRRTGMVFTYFGRPRLVGKYYNSSDPHKWAFADRTCVNSVCQGPVTGDTKVLVEDGYKRIDQLTGNEMCFTGTHWDYFSVVKQKNQECFKVTCEDGTVIKCSWSHIFKAKIKGKYQWLNGLPQEGDLLCKIKKWELGRTFINNYTTTKVVSVESIGKRTVYCLSLNNEEHQFITNGIVSHNCVPINQYIETEDGVIMYNKVLGKRLYQTYGKKHSFIYRILRLFNL